MHDADTDADLMKQRELLGECRKIRLVLGDLARDLDDKSLTLKPLDVR